MGRPGASAARRRPRTAEERGSALILLVLVTLSLAAISLAYVTVVPVSLRATRERTDQVRARYATLDASARARYDLRAGGAGNLDGNVEKGEATLLGANPDDDEDPFEGLHEADDGTWRVRTRALPDPDTYLIEAAAVRGGIVQQVAQVVRRQVLSPYTGAVFGASGIELGSTSRLMADSYDSEDGDYSDQAQNEHTTPDGKNWRYANDRGSLASDGSIALPDGVVFGDVRPGPGASYTPSEDTYVTGITAPAGESRALAPATWEVPTFDQEEQEDQLGDFYDGSGNYHAMPWVDEGNAKIRGGTYVLQNFMAFYKDVTLEPSSETNEVTIYVRGMFYIGDGAKVRVKPGTRVRIFHDGSWFVISGGGFDNDTGRAESLRMYLSADPSGAPTGPPPSVLIDSTSPLVATLYAPQSWVGIGTTQRHIYGSLVGDEVALNGYRTAFHYDESLATLEDEAPRVVRFENVASWWLTR